MKSSIILSFFACVLYVNGSTISTISDEVLLQFIKEKGKLVVLFLKEDCSVCQKFEEKLENLSDDFKKYLEAETVKVVDSHLSKLYSPNKEPLLVFFRHGIPLLYSGEPDENEIYSFFEKNQTPAVKELSDKIFEHMTQAATGATTGDWFIMFYGASCVECQRLHAIWESVGATLRDRVNVARIDATLSGANTAKRFLVSKLPTFIFFRLGKLYRYDLPKHDVQSFVTFAQDWYRNAKAEKVQIPASPFDELLSWCLQIIDSNISIGLNILKKYPWIWQIGVAGFGLVIITSLIALIKARQPKKTKDTKKEKKRK